MKAPLNIVTQGHLLKFFLLVLLTAFGFADEGFIEVKDAKIFYKTFGKGDPVVVLHGGPAFTHNYLVSGVLPFAENHQVILYDQRGCGKSSSEINEETMDLDLFTEDLDTLRKALGHEKITLLAHSWGGLLAMKYAMNYPERVKRFVLANSLPASFEDCFWTITESRKMYTPYKEELDRIEKSSEFLSGDLATIQKYLRLRAKGSFYDPDQTELLDISFSLEDFHHYTQISQRLAENLMIEDFNWYEDLRNFNFPSLVLHSDTDFIPVSDAEKVHQSIPGAEYVLLTECGHCPFIEKPEELFIHLSDFFNRNP